MTASYARVFYPFTISEKDYRLFSAAQNMVALRHGAKDTIFDFPAVYDGIFFLLLLIPDPCSDPEREKVHGNSGTKLAGKQPLLHAMLPETAHNPEAVGSSPASATRKVLKSVGFRTFF